MAEVNFINGDKLTSEQAMALAIQEAKKGFGFVSPNPPVGCVILNKDGELISRGYHKKCGEAHAEVEALNKIGDKKLLEGAHVFVTLEPCAHEGRTPSCAKTLASLPISTVIYGTKDPNPLVAGQGVEILRKANINVTSIPELENNAMEVAEIFMWNMKNEKPFVALKVATSLDGQMGLQNGESQWITNDLSRHMGHYLRGCYDAVLVGRRTFEIDNPSLNVRHENFANKINFAIVIDPGAKSISNIAESNLLKVRPAEKVIWVVQKGTKLDELKSKGIQVVEAPTNENGEINLELVLTKIYKELGICSIYLEGGAETYHQFLKQKKINRIYQFLAPSIIGSGNGVNWSGGLFIDSLSKKIELAKPTYKIIGDNILISGLIYTQSI